MLVFCCSFTVAGPSVKVPAGRETAVAEGLMLSSLKPFDQEEIEYIH
jgi:hypothetical protein